MCVDFSFGGQILSLDHTRTRAFVAASRVSYFHPAGAEPHSGRATSFHTGVVCLLRGAGLRSGRDTYSHTGAAFSALGGRTALGPGYLFLYRRCFLCIGKSDCARAGTLFCAILLLWKTDILAFQKLL